MKAIEANISYELLEGMFNLPPSCKIVQIIVDNKNKTFQFIIEGSNLPEVDIPTKCKIEYILRDNIPEFQGFRPIIVPQLRG